MRSTEKPRAYIVVHGEKYYKCGRTFSDTIENPGGITIVTTAIYDHFKCE